MSKQFEDVMAMGEARGRAEGEAIGETRGRAEGEAREKERSVLSVLGNGVSEEETARLLSLAVDEVREIAGRQKTAGASM